MPPLPQSPLREPSLLALGLTVLVLLMPSVDARQAVPAGMCRVDGKASSGAIPLPGVSLIFKAGDVAAAATSTEADGRYSAVLKPGPYHLSVTFSGFTAVERDVTLEGASCGQTLDFQLTLLARTARAARPGPAGGRGATASQPFEAVAVQQQAAGGLVTESAAEREAEEAAARQLLPPGFSNESPAQAVTFTGNTASLDRGMLGERFEAMGRGEFDPVTGELPAGFGIPGALEATGDAGSAVRAAEAGPEDRQDVEVRADPADRAAAGPVGAATSRSAARGGRQNTYNATANYTFGGSPLDAAPYQLRADSSPGRAPYTRQNFGGTFGGPLKIPGIYDGTRKTNFTVTYNGNRGDDLFDQYATVPSEAMRTGNFATASAQLVDPRTGLPLAGNQIPLASMSPAARALLQYIPSPNLPGTTPQLSLHDDDRVGGGQHQRPHHAQLHAGARRGAAAGRRRIRRPRRRRAGADAASRAPASCMNGAGAVPAQRQRAHQRVPDARRAQRPSSSLAVPISLNIAHRRTLHNVIVNLSRTSSTTINQYANVQDVAGDAGITGVATDPFDWGVPELSFSQPLEPARRRRRRDAPIAA